MRFHYGWKPSGFFAGTPGQGEFGRAPRAHGTPPGLCCLLGSTPPSKEEVPEKGAIRRVLHRLLKTVRS